MGYKCEVICDSISPEGCRITTLHIRFPRCILAQFNTHRVFSRNARSSRAVPTSVLLKEVMEDPYMPEVWGRNKKGMQSEGEISDVETAKSIWIKARDEAVEAALRLKELGVHKQFVNRLIEPYMWVDVLVTSTEWDNFFYLRMSDDAQPEIQKIARMMYSAIEESSPVTREAHLPYMKDSNLNESNYFEKVKDIILISAARCARVSYKPFNSESVNIKEDLRLGNQLLENGHMSPFEHQAVCFNMFRNTILGPENKCRNFIGWVQGRHIMECKYY